MRKVLIIEDDPIVAHIYETRLAKEGYEVEISADGQSGFYRIHEFRPDAVLLDLMLPKMNGIEILKKIRAQSQFTRMPVVVFTNAYVPNMIHEAFQAGATQVFNKATLTPRQILDALHTAILFASNDPQAAAAAAAPAGGLTPNLMKSEAVVSPLEMGTAPFHGAPARASTGPAPHAGPAQHAGSATPAGPAPAARVPETPALSAPGGTADEDAEFQAELMATFQQTAGDNLNALRRLLQDFTKAPDEASRLPHLLELYRKVHALTGSAGIAGLHCISQMCAAVEVLLRELHEKPKNINASTMRTVASAVDFVAELFAKGPAADKMPEPNLNILVVDDEILSRRAITYALEKADLKSVSVEDPQVALKLAGETSFAVIFLDVQMPGMDGFELCTKIRLLATNKNTPVIFVTSLTDFKSRAKSSLSGGNDLIAKPFMFIELSVKALTFVLRSRLAPKSQMAA